MSSNCYQYDVIVIGAGHAGTEAAAAAARGIAVRVAPDERDAAVLRDAIVRALTDRSMVDAATEVRDEIGDAAGPGEAVDWIEALVEGP